MLELKVIEKLTDIIQCLYKTEDGYLTPAEYLYNLADAWGDYLNSNPSNSTHEKLMNLAEQLLESTIGDNEYVFNPDNYYLDSETVEELLKILKLGK